MNLFNEEDVEIDVGEINKEIYDGDERDCIDYDKCKGCPLKGNVKVWNWRGNHNSKLCFVGMNPGTKEREFSYPFVGPSGAKFETRVIDKLDLGGKRKRPFGNNWLHTTGDFYLTNIVKCFTSGNKNPTKSAIIHCWDHLAPELEGRGVIVPLGKLAQKTIKEFYNGPAIVHNMIHPSAACRRGIYDAKLIRQAKKLGSLL